MNVKDQLKALMFFIHDMSPQDRRRFIMSFDEGMRCHYCRCKLNYTDKQSKQAPTYDHKAPLSRGGTDANENLVIACVGCNNAKGDMSYESFVMVNKPVAHSNKLMQKIHEQNVRIAVIEENLESVEIEKSKIMSWATRRINELANQLKQYDAKKAEQMTDISFNKHGGIIHL